jgi:hypothetical protein
LLVFLAPKHVESDEEGALPVESGYYELHNNLKNPNFYMGTLDASCVILTSICTKVMCLEGRTSVALGIYQGF